MNIEEYRNYCLSLPATSEDFPFDQNTLAFKICGKLFALTDVEKFESINIKCNPELAIELRERYPAVQPGYHMNKKHWNTIMLDGSVATQLLQDWVLHSYECVVAGLPKKYREVLSK